MGYLYLILTIICEVVAMIFMKKSAGFQSTFYTSIAFIFYALVFIFLTLALKNLQMGIANALWAGSSTVLISLAGIILFKEKMNPTQIIFLGMIVVGLIGLHYFEKMPTDLK